MPTLTKTESGLFTAGKIGQGIQRGANPKDPTPQQRGTKATSEFVRKLPSGMVIEKMSDGKWYFQKPNGDWTPYK